MVPLKRISQRGSSENVPQLMSYRNSGIYHRKTLRGVTRFIGGMGGVLNFPNFIVLPVIFSLSQVCFQTLWFQSLINILSILGSAVAVERIFSGGRDTISLRRASLKPATIRVLMLVKRRLILKRRAQRR